MSAAAMKRTSARPGGQLATNLHDIGIGGQVKCKWPGREPRPSQCVTSGLAPLLQRLDLDDRGAVVVADPEHRSRAGLLDEDAADVGRARQQIFGDLATLGV